jgi:hypothetical protein
LGNLDNPQNPRISCVANSKAPPCYDTIHTEFPLTGNSSSGDPITIADAEEGQIIQFTGGQWTFVDSSIISPLVIDMFRGPFPVSTTPFRLLVPGGTLGTGTNDHMDIVTSVRSLTGATNFMALGFAQPPGAGTTSIIRATYDTNSVNGVIYSTVYFNPVGGTLESESSYVYDNDTFSGASHDSSTLDPTQDWELTIGTGGAGATGTLHMMKYISYKT